jgi:hypothetical protein
MLPPIQPNKHTSFDPLIKVVREEAEKISDQRVGDTNPVADSIMSSIAMFSLKDPSLLKFQERRNDQNMKNIYHIDEVRSDTRMRETLDPIDPDSIRPMFQTVFGKIQKSGGLKPFVFHEGCYLLSLDGTEYFNSKKISCPCCMERKNATTGEITYYHQMVGAVLVHPDQKQVIPLAPEPIIKQDGDNKNDCERNATKRLIIKTREEHPHLKIIVVEDGLASNAPHIRLLKQERMHFILGAKPADHEHLFAQAIEAFQDGRMTVVRGEVPDKPGYTYEISFTHNLSLNKSNPDLLVNFLQYHEYDADGNQVKVFSWVTDLPITEENAHKLTRGGRARWKIENETFNTLKNQGYQFEHNFGHGVQNLSVVFSMLMMLTFLIDQTQEQGCPLFRSVRDKFTSRTSVWDHIRSNFRHFEFQSMQHLYELVLNDVGKVPAPTVGLYGSRVT